MYDPAGNQQQANFSGFNAVDPLGFLARIKALQAGQQGQNQTSAAVGTAGTDLAKIMQLLKQQQMLNALNNPNSQGIDPGAAQGAGDISGGLYA